MIAFSSFFWDPDPVLWKLPVLGWPVLWYGAIFACAFAISFPIFVKLLSKWVGKEKAIYLTDRILLYVIWATILGARLGHFIFYEKPSQYLLKPWEFFMPPYAGLASHGALIAIPIALYLFARRYKKELNGVGTLRLLDLISIPAALVGGFIRIGNFINQEILGKATKLPWGVVFGHPADHSLALPRHPVQLYEAFCYFSIFGILWAVNSKSKPESLPEGRLIGIFFVLVFSARFIIEYWKLEQSNLMPFGLNWTMGQLLSVPAIIIGLFLILRKKSSLTG